MTATRSRTIVERLVRFFLLAGIVYFGFILPDSVSDHDKILHFSAHMGMSFFMAICLFVICNVMLHISKSRSLAILVVATLIAGAIYKYLEIMSQGLFDIHHLGWVLKITGVYTSMSQNTAGMLAAILLIEYIIAYVRRIGHHRLKEIIIP